MKIVQFLHGNKLGGMEKFCIDLSNALSKEHEVLFLGDSIFRKYLENKVNFITLDITKSRNNLFFLWDVFQIFKTFSPDVIHLHKQKSIDMMKRLDPFLKTPFIATKHDTQKKKSFRWIENIITISDETTKTVQANNIYKIYNGIQYIKPKKVIMPKGFNIVAVGGLRDVKGYSHLINAISKLTFEYHLTIIGEGSKRESLEKQIAGLGLQQNISLIGFKLNVNDYLYSTDLQIISSESEGFSLSMIEGIFHSDILLSTKVSGCMEILSDKLLYNMNDLIEKINDVYTNKEQYIEEFSEIKKLYQERLTIDKCAKRHEKVYEDVINKRMENK